MRPSDRHIRTRLRAAPLALAALLALTGAVLTFHPATAAAAPGDTQWLRRIPGGSYANGITKVVPAPNGGIYAVGWQNRPVKTKHGYIGTVYVARLTALGKLLWSRNYGSARNHGTQFPFAAVDGAGNVVVACPLYRPGHELDVAVLKYSPSGKRLWVSLLDGPAQLDDRPVGLGVDADGDAYVAGTSWLSAGTEMREYKLRAADGATLWEYVYPGEPKADELFGMVVTSAGTSYLAGNAHTLLARADVAQQQITFSVSADGALRWAKRLPGVMYGMRIVAAPGGGCRVAGYRPAGFDVLSYDDAGVRIGESVITPPAGATGVLAAKGLAVAPDGDTVLATGIDYVYKIAVAGTVQWSMTLNPGGSLDLGFRDATTDATGAIYVTGQQYGSGPRVYKLSSLGGPLWTWSKPKASGWGYSLLSAPGGALYVGGSIRDGLGMVVRLAP